MNSTQPLIMVTNDDGIDSPGLHALVDALADLGEVVIAAPTTQQTAQSRSMNGDRSVSFVRADQRSWPEGVQGWHIAATPALAVRHALAVLTPHRLPDLLVSGINYGENLGNNITISGTVGAAFQAAAQGVPALAVSRQTPMDYHYHYGDLDWNAAAGVTRRWVQRLLQVLPATLPLPFDVLKIDVPDPCPPGTEERFTRLSRQPYFISVMENPSQTDPLSRARTAIQVDPQALDPGDDIYAVAVDRVVSVTPLTLDCTASLADTVQLLKLKLDDSLLS